MLITFAPTVLDLRLSDRKRVVDVAVRPGKANIGGPSYLSRLGIKLCWPQIIFARNFMRTGNRQHDRFVGRAAGRQAKRDLLLNEPRLDSGRLEVGLVLWLVLRLNTGTWWCGAGPAPPAPRSAPARPAARHGRESSLGHRIWNNASAAVWKARGCTHVNNTTKKNTFWSRNLL